MNKRFAMLLTALLGVSVVLVYLLIGLFLFRKGVILPKVLASPATCEVDDDLVINQSLGVGTATLDPNYEITTSGGGIKADSATQPAGYFNSSSGYGLLVDTGNVGIGTTTPSALLSVGSTSQFRVNSSGNLIRINNVGYSWPALQGAANTFLRNDGAGNLSWVAAGAGGGYTTIQDEGASLTQRSALNFTGAGVTCVDNAGSARTDCTISGGGLPAGTSGQTLRHDGADWVANSLLYNDGTNVGIGATTTPAAKLHIASWDDSTKLIVSGDANGGDSGGIEVQYHVDGASTRTRAKLAISGYNGYLALKDGSNNQQVFITSNGSSYINGGGLGIGTTSLGNYQLKVLSFVGANNYGIHAQASPTTGGGENYGIYGYSNSGGLSSTNYGIYGRAMGAAGSTNYGLYGWASGGGGATNWGLYVAAGNAYFAGDAEINGNLNIGGDIDANGNGIYGRPYVTTIKIECNGGCTDEPSPEAICQNWGSEYHVLSVACSDVADDKADKGNFGCGTGGNGICETASVQSDSLGYWCDDTTGWDGIITCIDSNR